MSIVKRFCVKQNEFSMYKNRNWYLYYPADRIETFDSINIRSLTDTRQHRQETCGTNRE